MITVTPLAAGPNPIATVPPFSRALRDRGGGLPHRRQPVNGLPQFLPLWSRGTRIVR